MQSLRNATIQPIHANGSVQPILDLDPDNPYMWESVNIACHGLNKLDQNLSFLLDKADFCKLRNDDVCTNRARLVRGSRPDSIIMQWERVISKHAGSIFTAGPFHDGTLAFQLCATFVKKIRGQMSEISKMYPCLKQNHEAAIRDNRRRRAVYEFKNAVRQAARTLTLDEILQSANETLIEDVLGQ